MGCIIVCGHKGAGKSTCLQYLREKGLYTSELHDEYLALSQLSDVAGVQREEDLWIGIHQVRIVSNHVYAHANNLPLVISGVYRRAEIDYLHAAVAPITATVAITCDSSRRIERVKNREGSAFSLESFTREERWRHGLVSGHEETNVSSLIDSADIVIDNSHSCVSRFYADIESNIIPFVSQLATTG